MRRIRRIAALSSAVALVVTVAVACTPPTNPPVDSGVIASQVPANGTPNFGPPGTPPAFGTEVDAIAQVGNFMVAGGTFTQVNGSTRPYLAAWGAPSGTDFSALPATTVNNTVFAIEPTAGRSGFYAAGKFTTANGIATNVALYNLKTHSIVSSFRVQTDGTIQTMQLVGNHLLIGGLFSHVNSSKIIRFGLASVNATTGAVDNYLQIHVAGHHNFLSPKNHGTVNGAVGVQSMAVSPDGSRMMVIGNFTQAFNNEITKSGFARDQVMRVNLGATSATVDPTWSTSYYTQACNEHAFDSYVSQVAYAPDGSYFVIVDAGGYQANSHVLCDSAARFNSNTVTNAVPTWAQWTGTDSLYSVAITSAAVYVGGHERWFNNPAGQDNAQAGAVPRAGIAALDPAVGEPLAWNPGRSPRGHGTSAIYTTKTGVWFGSDGDCIGPGQGNSCAGAGTYPRGELAFFPYAGGTLPAANSIGAGTRIVRINATLTQNGLNPANGAGGPIANPNQFSGSTAVRGAFSLDGNVYYGKSDGTFNFRTYRGGVWGPENQIDPYNDPAWDSVLTGSGQPYQGKIPLFYTLIPRITAMFYQNRFIYYTLNNGDPRLYRVAFSPGTQPSTVGGHWTGGVINAIPQVVVNTGGRVNFSNVQGMFLAGGRLWIASRTSGALYAVGWNGTTVTTGSNRAVFAGGAWNGLGVFVSQ
jgi:hypothetical protein